MVYTFQSIFNEQTVDNSPDSIDYFLTLNNDEEPLNELKRRAIPEHIKVKMGGISNPLKNAVPYIIGSQQKAYVPNDNKGSILLNLLVLIEDCKRKKNKG